MPTEMTDESRSPTSHTPLDAFHGWLDEQPEEVRNEICAWIEMLLVRSNDTNKAFDRDHVRTVREWNKISIHDSPLVIGRAVSIRAIIEHQFSSYFTLDHWKLAKYVNTDMAERLSKKGNESIAFKAVTSVDDFPRRRRQWRDVGISWGKFLVEHFNDERIEEWFNAHSAELDKVAAPSPGAAAGG